MFAQQGFKLELDIHNYQQSLNVLMQHMDLVAILLQMAVVLHRVMSSRLLLGELTL